MLSAVSATAGVFAQTQQEIVEKITAEANENSQLKELAHEVLDGVGPRL